GRSPCANGSRTVSLFSQNLGRLNGVIVATLAASGADDRLFGSSSPIAHVAAAGQPVAFVELVCMAPVKAASAAAVFCWRAGSECRALPRWIAALLPAHRDAATKANQEIRPCRGDAAEAAMRRSSKRQPSIPAVALHAARTAARGIRPRLGYARKVAMAAFAESCCGA